MIASLLKRFTRTEEGSVAGRVIHIPGLFYRFDNSRSNCGHIRLFAKPTRGWMIHTWSQLNPEWSKNRVWWFGLFSILHVDAGPNNELKHSTTPGWHVRFARFEAKRIYGGFSLAFRTADKGYSA